MTERVNYIKATQRIGWYLRCMYFFMVFIFSGLLAFLWVIHITIMYFVVTGNRNVSKLVSKYYKHFVFGDTTGLAKDSRVHCLFCSRLPFPFHPRIEHMCQAFKFRNKYSVIKLKLRKYTRDQAHHNFATLLQILYLYYSKVHFVDFLMLS